MATGDDDGEDKEGDEQEDHDPLAGPSCPCLFLGHTICGARSIRIDMTRPALTNMLGLFLVLILLLLFALA